MVAVPRRRDLKICGLALATMALFVALHLVGADLHWLRRFETATLDLRVRLRGVIPPGPETVIVLMDDQTITELGRWPLARQLFARLVDTLQRAGARVIAFDILFAEPDAPPADGAIGFLERATAMLRAHGLDGLADEVRERSRRGDSALAAAMAAAGNVVLPFSFRFGADAGEKMTDAVGRSAYASLRAAETPSAPPFEPTGILAPIPDLGEAASALGHVLVAFDVDGAPRYDYPVIEYDLDYFPSLPVRIVQRYLALPWNEVVVTLGRGVAIGPLFVPTDAAMRSVVNYRGPPRSFPTYPFASVLAGAVPDAAFRDRIVLIGANIVGIKDSFPTPFTAVLPGVERLATIVDTTLHSDHITRPVAAPAIEAAALLLCALVIGGAVARLSMGAATLAAVAIFALLGAAGQVALVHYGLWFAAALPAVALVLTFATLMLYRYGLLDREHRAIRNAFSHYLSPDMVERLARSPESLRLGGELRELTILFCDLRGSTSLSERLDPQRMTRIINDFFTPMTEAILAHGGTVGKFTGDGIMAFWNAPLAEPAHAERACRAALAMMAALARLNERLARSEPAVGRLAIGIGINTGPCVVGNFGSKYRFDYSVMGDPANVAARLESETKTYNTPIIIGPETAARAPMLASLPIGRIHLRGREQPLEIHALLGDETLSGAPGAATPGAHPSPLVGEGGTRDAGGEGA